MHGDKSENYDTADSAGNADTDDASASPEYDDEHAADATLPMIKQTLTTIIMNQPITNESDDNSVMPFMSTLRLKTMVNI